MVFKAEIIFTITSILFFSIIHIITGSETKYVTCGSVLKLLNSDYEVRLHSHDINYGTGSGQQSVTGTKAELDGNSYWRVKEALQECKRGTPINCTNIIRLEHMTTKKNLHSHHHKSPLSGRQEVSAYGDSNGNGDTGDHWIVMCSSKHWNRDENVMFKHVDTARYLAVTEKIYSAPIHGQSEVVCEYAHNTRGAYWRSTEGMFIHSDSEEDSDNLHDEL